MALRATATVRQPSQSPPPSSPSLTTNNLSKITTSKPQSKCNHPLLLSATATLPLFAPFALPLEARALSIPKEQIVSSLYQVESTVDQAVEVGSNFFSAAGQVIGAVVNALKPGVEVTLPILKQAGEQAVKIASPVVSEASKKAQEAIESSGIDTQPLITAAKTVADAAQQTTKVAKPIAVSTVETISSTEPVVILETAGALVLAYLLLPPIFSAVSFKLRGYRGDLTPAQTLDLMSTKNYIMIDIRSEKDKNKDGITRLPSTAKNKLINIPLEDLPSKLRGLVRSTKKVEAELVAMKISYLKKISKSSNIVIMDSYSGAAKIVATALTRLGFNCWIVNDGFSGSKGWSQSRLGTDSYSFTVAEVMSPSRVIPAATRRLGTSSSAKLLPGGSD